MMVVVLAGHNKEHCNWQTIIADDGNLTRRPKIENVIWLPPSLDTLTNK